MVQALVANLVSWFVRNFAPSLLPKLLPHIPQEEKETQDTDDCTRCIVIGRPGGREQLRTITLKKNIATCGYNVKGHSPFTKDLSVGIPGDCIVLSNKAFSVNFADCCIRWGLYESANTFVGWPICPGFDIAGVVEKVGRDVKDFHVGDRVFGCSLFGSYSTRLLVPAQHVRPIPLDYSFVQAASLPTVALTSLYALFLAGHFPTKSEFSNRAILIHSAAGGVGSMLVQMSKLLGLSPVVGVVGRSNKVDAAKSLGCDVVIDKSSSDLWQAARAASPNGYATIMDASGVETVSQSYEHLAPTGRLIVYGFHTNLPTNSDALSPWQWLRMGLKQQRMPKLNVMEMGTENKAVLAFNLSFFADETEMLSHLFDQILSWIQSGELVLPRVVELEMTEIRQAHDLIQSGRSIGKIVLTTESG